MEVEEESAKDVLSCVFNEVTRGSRGATLPPQSWLIKLFKIIRPIDLCGWLGWRTAISVLNMQATYKGIESRYIKIFVCCGIFSSVVQKEKERANKLGACAIFRVKCFGCVSCTNGFILLTVFLCLCEKKLLRIFQNHTRNETVTETETENILTAFYYHHMRIILIDQQNTFFFMIYT